MLELEYLTDKSGQLKAVVIPVEIWNTLFIENDTSPEALSEAIENYALNKAMDEAEETPLLNREEALAYLES
ncbi:MAG: hypothetical protein HF973_03360 [Chloroflexi bacterium]|nr:hypothetical protein [Chloroflexota bacterium]